MQLVQQDSYAYSESGCSLLVYTELLLALLWVLYTRLFCRKYIRFWIIW